jgi:hypothetical protein
LTRRAKHLDGFFSVADDAAINNPHMPERVTLTQFDSIDEMHGANVVAMKVA